MGLAQAVQSALFNGVDPSLAYATNPTAGHLLVAVWVNRGYSFAVTTPAGWSVAGVGGHDTPDNNTVYYRAAPGGPVTFAMSGTPQNEQRLTLMEFDTPATLGNVVTHLHSSTTVISGVPYYPFNPLAVTLTAGQTAILLTAIQTADTGGPITAEIGWTEIDEGFVAGGLSPLTMISYKEVTSSGSYTHTVQGDDTVFWGGVLAAFVVASVFTADFTADTLSGSVPLSVDFTDTSFGGTGTANSWDWDWGDGTTHGTTQNPTHVYTIAGSYTVTLTAGTTTAETDTESKVAYIVAGDVYVPPSPSNAVIEIYAASPGSARWGIAHWGEDVWSTAGWQDVTPESIDAQVAWGSHSPRDGILAETEAATWLINTYDPDRLMDPGNLDSPYVTDLKGGLPVRIRHRGTIVRQGIAERIVYFHKDKQGGMRVTDNLSLMARTPVPSDSVLSDTLRERARDAISAAGLRLTVEPDPPTGDPALAPRLDGDRSVWRHIADAAQQALHIAYIDRIGTVRFRPWASPYDRGRGVDETQLVDLGTEVSSAGLYSVIRARDEITEDLLERRLTPTPYYGPVTYTRDDLTPDADGWADAVLADRSLQTVQWIPGEIYPLDADAVEYFATLEALELFSVSHANTDPAVSILGTIVGGDFRVISKRGGEAIWSFSLELAQTALAPLIETGGESSDFLLATGGDQYLYPST